MLLPHVQDGEIQEAYMTILLAQTVLVWDVNLELFATSIQRSFQLVGTPDISILELLMVSVNNHEDNNNIESFFITSLTAADMVQQQQSSSDDEGSSSSSATIFQLASKIKQAHRNSESRRNLLRASKKRRKKAFSDNSTSRENLGADPAKSITHVLVSRTEEFPI